MFSLIDYYLSTSWQERYELVDGKCALVRRPTIEGRRVAAALRTFLDVFAAKLNLGTVLAGSIYVNLSDTEVTCPHIVLVSRDRKRIIAEGVVYGVEQTLTSPTLEGLNLNLGEVFR